MLRTCWNTGRSQAEHTGQLRPNILQQEREEQAPIRAEEVLAFLGEELGDQAPEAVWSEAEVLLVVDEADLVTETSPRPAVETQL